MDPDCAICHAPVSLKCDCEAQSLEVAILQAEGRVMQQIYEDIRVWVRTHARDYILEYFSLLTERRNQAHIQNMERIRQRAAFHYHAQPHPAEIAAAQATLKRGIDEDWQSSVQRYPEVLEHYFGLVELVLPADDDPMVRDPPLSALSGRKPARRGLVTAPSSGPGGGGGGGGPGGPGSSGMVPVGRGDMPPMPPPPQVGMGYAHPRGEMLPRGRTPPPPPAPSERMDRMDRMDRMERMERMERMDRRTPVPRDGRRSSYRPAPPPPPPSSYYPSY